MPPPPVQHIHQTPVIAVDIVAGDLLRCVWICEIDQPETLTEPGDRVLRAGYFFGGLMAAAPLWRLFADDTLNLVGRDRPGPRLVGDVEHPDKGCWSVRVGACDVLIGDQHVAAPVEIRRF